MYNIQTEATNYTPEINFDSERGLIEIKGKLLPEDIRKTFTPLLGWLDEYSTAPPPQTQVTFILTYLNSGAAKAILEFFKRLENLHKEGLTQLDIQWVYEEDDLDIKESGEAYSNIFDIPFRMVSQTEYLQT